MRRTLLSWNTLFAKLAFSNDRPAKVRQRNYLTRRLRMESLENRHLLAITVDNPLDELDADRSPGDTSLREAIADANPAGETINFAASLNGATIALLPNLGQIQFAKSLTIDGRDSNGVPRDITIDAGGGTNEEVGNEDGFRIFNISGTGEVEIDALTLTGGDPGGNGGAISCEAANLTLKNSVITGNASQDSGGGIFAQSSNVTIIESSEVSGNSSGSNGGGVFFDGGDELNVVASTISGNTGGNTGGGIWAYGRYTSGDIQSG